MKPPPQLLILLLLLILGAVLIDAKCSDFKNNILVNQKVTVTDLERVGSYITNQKGDKYFLHCYIMKENPNEKLFVIIPPQEKHVVTVTGLNCDQDFLAQSSYMFVKEEPLTEDHKNVLLAFGFLPSGSTKWCQFAICINCELPSPTEETPIQTVNYEYNGNTKPDDVEYFQWSENAVLIYKKPKFENLIDGIPVDQDGAVEYVSAGHPKVVFLCHRNIGAIVRSPRGQHIVTIKNIVCPPDSFIQTFYVYKMKNGKTEFPKGVPVSHLDEDIKESEDDDLDEKMFYYYIAPKSSVMCYWEKINTEKPNTCPSLPHDAMILTPVDDFRETSELVRMYRNHVKPTIVLNCFKNYENDKIKYFSVVTDSKGNHLVTVTNIDCSSKENVDDRIFVHTTYGDDDTTYFVVGTRWSVTDDWCAYSIYKADQNTHIKWVYYNYNPKDTTLSWVEGGVLECPDLEKINIATEYKEPPTEDLTSRHLWPTDPFTDSLFVYCYTSSIQGNIPHYTNVIKTLKGEAIVSIIGVDCLFKQAKDNTFYISKEKIGHNNYLIIGTRTSSEEKWCQYEVCVDCQKKEVKRNFESFSFDYTNKWSEAGVKLSGDTELILPDYDPRNTVKQYLSTSGSKFVLVCLKPKEEEGYKWVLRRARGIQIATFTNGLECSEKTLLDFKFYIHKQSANGESNIYSYEDCSDGCELGNSESWFYYFVNREGLRFLEDKNKAELNSCEGIKRENILIKESDFLKQEEKKSTFWNGGNVIFTLTCYRTTEPYAVIARGDEHILTIKDFDCLDKETNVQKLYIHTTSGDEDVSQVVVGSQKESFSEWCFYNVFRSAEKNNVWLHHGYQSDKLAHQWYKEGTCPAVLSESILFDENEKSLSNKRLISKYMMVVSEGDVKQKEMFYTYCYYMERAGGSGSHALVLRNMEEHHLVTLRDFDCSTFNLEENAYIFTMTDSGYPDYLAFGTRASIKDDWCQYDIFLNLKKVRTNINPGKIKKFFWEKADSESCPAVKSENIITNEKPNALDEQHSMAFYLSLEYNSEFLVREAFRTYCYKEENNAARDEGPSMLGIRTLEGRHLATLRDFDCSIERDSEKSYMFKLEYSGHEYLALGTRNSYEDKWCRYDICLNCETKTVRRNVHIVENEDKIFQSKVPAETCYIPRENIFTHLSEVKIIKDYKVVATYINEDQEDEDTFVLVCYKKDNSFITLLNTLGNRHVVSIKNLDCSSHDTLTRISYMFTKRVNGNRYLSLGIRGEEKRPWCQYDICISCSNKDIQVNAGTVDGPGSLTTFKWSMKGVTVFIPEKNRCIGFTDFRVESRHVHTKHLEFTIECYKFKSPLLNHIRCAVFKRQEILIASFETSNCETFLAIERKFYLYTLYRLESKFRLIRLDQTKDIHENSITINRLYNGYEQRLYFFGKEKTKTSDWIQVKNPKISSGEFILKFEENEECLPKSKRRADLEKVEPKVNQKKVTNARKSLFSGLRTSLRRRKPVD